MILRNIVIISSLIALTACAPVPRSKAPGTGVDGIAASSYGIGERQGFDGNDSASTSLKAPHQQTYLFTFDKSNVAQQDIPSVEAQAQYLRSHPNARVLLTGNTDERGSREYNIGLGEDRAEHVADVLKLAGVDKEQVRIVSYGEEKPNALGHDENAYRLNRRVELRYEDLG